jgi:hypothetical protein
MLWVWGAIGCTDKVDTTFSSLSEGGRGDEDVTDDTAASGSTGGGSTVTYAGCGEDGQLVQNGGFEDPVISGSFYQGTTLTGWSFSEGTIDVMTDLYDGTTEVPEGTQMIDLDGASPAIMEQTLSPTAGVAYTLSLHVSGNPGYVHVLAVTWNGTSVLEHTFDATGLDWANLQWEGVSADLGTLETVPSGGVVLSLTDVSGKPSGAGPLLDSICVFPTPIETGDSADSAVP